MFRCCDVVRQPVPRRPLSPASAEAAKAIDPDVYPPELRIKLGAAVTTKADSLVMKDPLQAVQLYNEALKLRPADDELLMKQCLLLIQLRRFGEALTWAYTLVTLKPDSPAAYATLGEAQMGLEQYTEALRYFERARVLVARGKLGSEMEQTLAAKAEQARDMAYHGTRRD